MKVYKITLRVSFWIFAILTLLSIFLNFWNDNEWIAFIVSWCVGIACSIVVVIITTFIQFNVEQKKAINQLASNVRTILFQNELNGIIFSSSPDIDISYLSEHQIRDFEKSWLESMQESIKSIYLECGNIEFLGKSKEIPSIMTAIASLRFVFIAGGSIADMHSKLQENLYILAKETLSLDFKGYSREEIEKYVAMYEKNKSFQRNFT